MENIINKKEKKNYKKPEFSKMKIDNEISLVMMSANPNQGDGDHPFGYFKQDNYKSEPFKC